MVEDHLIRLRLNSHFHLTKLIRCCVHNLIPADCHVESTEKMPRRNPVVFLLCSSVLFLGSHPVSGGVCWSTLTATGRCKDVVQTSISREQCCSLAGGLAAYTEENYDDGQTLFYNLLGGGAPNCKSCSQSCDGIKCPADEVCEIHNGQPRCGCQTQCPTPPHIPGTNRSAVAICGSSGQTFKSQCHLKRHNCHMETRFWADYDGHCQHSCDTVKCKDDQHCIVDKDHTPHCVRCMARCPPITSLMCGTDGVTYENMCYLHKAACENKSKKIKYAHRGSCKSEATCKGTKCSSGETCKLDSTTRASRCVRCDINCSSNPDNPVCGSDGVTYSNWCQMRQNSCSFGMLIHVESIGACEKKNRTR